MLRKKTVLTVVGFLCLVAIPGCGYNKADLIGKWELQEGVAGMPKGAIWEFESDGNLQMTMNGVVAGKKGDFKWSLKGKILELEALGKKDTTEVVTLTKTELVCRDRDGTTAKFKKVP